MKLIEFENPLKKFQWLFKIKVRYSIVFLIRKNAWKLIIYHATLPPKMLSFCKLLIFKQIWLKRIVESGFFYIICLFVYLFCIILTYFKHNILHVPPPPSWGLSISLMVTVSTILNVCNKVNAQIVDFQFLEKKELNICPIYVYVKLWTCPGATVQYISNRQ